MTIKSPSFEPDKPIPDTYTCKGKNINPEFHIDSSPSDTKSFALIMDDPDAPGGTFTHWLIWNIPSDTLIIREGAVPEGAVQGQADFGFDKYGGPCPPPGSPHHYHFKLYALDDVLELKAGASREALEEQINAHLLEKAEIVGIYQR